MGREHASRAWRVVATALCFGVFGLGGLALRLLVFPVLRRLTPDRRRRAERTRVMVRALCRFFVALMARLGVLSVEFNGADKLQRRGQIALAKLG